MKLGLYFNKFKNNQDGSVIVIIAFLMTIIIGISALVLDLGFAFFQKAELQKDLDSIALAAVRELPATTAVDDPNWIKAVKVAEKYAEWNGLTISENENLEKVVKGGQVIGIKVKSDLNVSYNFAKVLGFNATTLKGKSRAELVPVSETDKIIPFAMDYNTFNIIKTGSSTPIYFDSNHATETGGWFGILGVDHKSDYTDSELMQYGSNWFAYQLALANGSKNDVSIGQIIDMETGSMGTHVKAAYDKRVEEHKYCYYDYTNGYPVKSNNKGDNLGKCEKCPRLVTVPIIFEKVTLLSMSQEQINDLAEELGIGVEVLNSIQDSDSKKEVLVVALATVFLKDLVKTQGNQYQLMAGFVSTNVLGGNSRSGVVLNDLGVRKAKLVNYEEDI